MLDAAGEVRMNSNDILQGTPMLAGQQKITFNYLVWTLETM